MADDEMRAAAVVAARQPFQPGWNKGYRRVWQPCSSCHGSGATPWSGYVGRCDFCNGHGGWNRYRPVAASPNSIAEESPHG